MHDARHGPERPSDDGSVDDRNIGPAFEQVYDELKRVAERYFSEQPPGHTLQPTALVNEAFLRLARIPGREFADCSHLKATAARAMRQILVDHARKRRAAKRGAGLHRLTFDERLVSSQLAAFDIVDLDIALNQLEEHNDRTATVVEMRFFGGMTIAETAEALGISSVTVTSDWRFARSWLANQLESPSG